MVDPKCRRLAARAAALGMGGVLAFGAVALAGEPTQQQLLEQMKVLQSKVERLEAKQEQTAKAADTREVDATADRVLKDAERRSQLLADGEGFTAGYSKGKFLIQSADGNFYFHPGLIFQVRNAVNFRDNAKNGGDDFQEGFEIRRAKFSFDGNVFTKDLTYKLQWQDSNNGGTPTLEWGYAQYVFAHDWHGADLGLKAGQFKDPVFKEEAITGDQTQLMVERSLANTLVGGISSGPLIQGVDLVVVGNDNPLHADLVLYDGAASGNTDFQNVLPSGAKTNFGVAARVDYKFFGDWGDTTVMNGKGSKHDLLDVGGGVDFSQADNSDAVRWDIDAQYLIAGRYTIFGAIYGNNFDFRNQTGPGSRNDYGGVVEAGYFLNSAWEIAARYSIVRIDSDFKTNGEDTFHEIGVGLAWFLGEGGAAGNHAKFSIDLNYLPNGTPAATGLDYLASPGDSQIVLRTQFQLWL